MGTPLRVLIVEDSEEDTLLIVRELKRGGFDPIHERVETAEAMKAALFTETWDLILADYAMPHFSGLEALKFSKESELDLPFIIVSGSIGEDVAVEAMKSGAHDYIMKNNLARLVPAIQQELREAEVRRKLKHSEKALQEAEKRYRQVVENATEIIYAVDEKGNFTYGNPTSLKVTGFSLEQLRQYNYQDLVVPEHRERVLQAYINQLRERRSTSYIEFPFFSKSGEIIWFGQNASLVIEKGKVVGFHIIARDITERKRGEEALRWSEETARALLNATTDSVFLIDRSGTVLALNEMAGKRLNRRVDEILGACLYDFLPPDLAKRRKARFDQVFHSGNPAYFEDERQGIHFDNCAYPVSDVTGKVMKIAIYGRDITERKKAEVALRESEERNRTLVETSPDAITLLDLNLNIIMANQPALKLYGHESAEEIKGKNGFDYLALEERGRATEDMRKMLETGSMGPIEYTLVKKNGTPFPAELKASLVLDAQKKPSGIILVSRDITERKKAEEALRESEEKYRTILENIEDGYYEVDIAGNFAFFNDSFCRIYGYPREELIGMNDRQYTDQENAKKLFQTFNRVYRTGESAKGTDWEIIRKDGTKRNIEASVSLIKDASGNQIGFRGLVHDITERKKAEEQLSKLFRAVEQSPATVMITDTDANIEYVNPKFTQLTGYTLEEVIGKNPRILKSGETPPEEYKRLWDTITSGREWQGEFHNKKKNGELYWESASISSIKNAEGLITHLVAVKEDITGRKRAEEERAALQEQLRQSQKMEAIGKLAGGVAHDFNNLLTVIKGYCQLSLVEMKESAPIRDTLEVINKAAEKAADLTRQLLAFSRRQIMEMRVLDLNALLQNLDKMLRRIIGEDIELVTSLGEDLGRVKADPGQIEQVVMNLAVNAKDAMSKGGKLIIETANVELDEAYARTHVAVTPGPYVMIAVSDTGTGMPLEVRDRVFEPFFTTKGKGKGTGLGLSTVYGIVKQSNGNIWVYSEPGKGTTFKIFLPRVDEPAEKLKVQEIGEEFPRGSETILVVEDDKEVRNLTVRILKRQGYTVLDGSYGDEAFSVCRQHKGPIHLLLTDVVMPGMDGRALSESLSQLHPEMKVLYMSGYTDDAIVHHGVMEKGMNYIQKPFTVNGLTKKVRELLDKSRHN
jgi:PAS domain S-box-containing protein